MCAVVVCKCTDRGNDSSDSMLPMQRNDLYQGGVARKRVGYLDHCSSALVRGTYWIVSQPFTYHDSEKYLFFDLAIHALIDLIEVPNVNI